MGTGNGDRGWGRRLRTWMGTQDRDRDSDRDEDKGQRQRMERRGGNVGWSREMGTEYRRGWGGNMEKRVWEQGHTLHGPCPPFSAGCPHSWGL